MSDNDWFERALRDLEEEAADHEAADDADADGASDDGSPDIESDEPPFDWEEEFEDLAGPPRSADGEADEAGGLFEEDFTAAFAEDARAGIGGPTTDPSAFDEPVDSALPRLDLGIEGLDAMIQGGVPERSLISVIGGAGTGKTTFAMQFLHAGLQAGERGVFLTLEQSRGAVLDTAEELGWDFAGYAEAGDLAVIEFDPIGMANSLASIRDDLPRLIGDFGADRFVLDSVSLLEMMYEDQSKRRNEIYDFTWSLKESGVTPMLTSEASDASEFASRYGIVEYLTDAVFILRNIRAVDYQESRLGVEIMKIRNTHHSRETKPFEIGEGGLEVYRQATIF